MSNKKFIMLKRVVYDKLKACNLCPRNCGVNRIKGELGFCKVPLHSKLCKELTHYAEEPDLIPTYSLYFSGCNMRCLTCSNAFMLDNESEHISFVDCQKLAARIDAKVNAKKVNSLFLLGGEATCNLYDILDILDNMKTSLPIVWNSNMYFSEDASQVIGEFADVFLADIKFGCDKCAQEISNTPNYLSTVLNNIEKMVNSNKRVVIRHLALSGHCECCTKPILKFIANKFPNLPLGIISLIPNGDNSIKAPSKNELKRIDELINELNLKKIEYQLDHNDTNNISSFDDDNKVMESLLHIRKDGTIVLQDVTGDMINLLKKIQ